MKKTFNECGRRVITNAWPLYGAVFAMATSLSVLWTAMPFIIDNIGGTKEHVGYVWAANMCGYVLCILIAARMLGHLKPRHVTRTAVAVVLLANAVMIVAAYLATADGRSGDTVLIWTIIAAGTVAGAAMSLFWPFLMTWVSADYEGAALNRRLGTYNGMWSAAAIMGPLIGGMLVDANTLGPIALAIGALGACFVLLCLAHDRSAGVAASGTATDAPTVSFDQRQLLRFTWMARIALFCSWLTLGVSRSQFALLFTSMGFSETQFGMIITAFGICNFAVLAGAGRVGFWHFKATLLLGGQLLLVVSVLFMMFGHTLGVFFIAFLIMGSSFGFAYSSHLYYGACSSKKRALPMAIHEITLSLGVIVGSGAGGYLSGAYGEYSPYWFAVVVLGVGVATQAILWVALRPKEAALPVAETHVQP